MNDMIDEMLREHDKITKEKKSMSLAEFFAEYISTMQLTHSEKCLRLGILLNIYCNGEMIGEKNG